MVIGIVQEIRSKSSRSSCLDPPRTSTRLTERKRRNDPHHPNRSRRPFDPSRRRSDPMRWPNRRRKHRMFRSNAYRRKRFDRKEVGNRVLSGSFVISGKAMMQVEQVGEDTYIHSILKEAKRNKRYPSQLRDAIQTIIRICTFSIIPSGSYCL